MYGNASGCSTSDGEYQKPLAFGNFLSASFTGTISRCCFRIRMTQHNRLSSLYGTTLLLLYSCRIRTRGIIAYCLVNNRGCSSKCYLSMLCVAICKKWISDHTLVYKVTNHFVLVRVWNGLRRFSRKYFVTVSLLLLLFL